MRVLLNKPKIVWNTIYIDKELIQISGIQKALVKFEKSENTHEKKAHFYNMKNKSFENKSMKGSLPNFWPESLKEGSHVYRTFTSNIEKTDFNQDVFFV